jgi:hypothetical protein
VSDLTLEQLEALLRSAGKNVDEVVGPIVGATAQKVKATQEDHVPVDTGRTKKSIKATGPKGTPLTKKSLEAEVGPTWYVGRLLELGTATRGPRVFVADSLDPHLASHSKATLDAVAKALFEKAS